MTTGASADAIEVATTDHRAVEQLFRHVRAAAEAGAVENQRDLAQRIVRELSVHAAVEEQVLYPAARDLLPDGQELADDGLRTHAEVKQVLAELDGCDPAHEHFEATVGRLMALVEAHVEEEERDLLPELRRQAGQERLQELGTAMERAKKPATTRPLPYAPDRPPTSIVAGAVAAVADLTRDTARTLVREPYS